MINRNPLEWTTALYVAIFLTLFIMLGNEAMGQTKPKSKFYDFNDQLIDGQIKKPTTLFLRLLV